jgi:CRP-like cAMP-binding protein
MVKLNPFHRRSKGRGRHKLDDDDDDAISLSTLESGTRRSLPSSSVYGSGGRGRSDMPYSSSRNGARSGGVDDSKSDAGSELSAGPEKWRRVRRGAHLKYVPFDVGELEEAEDDQMPRDTRFPPLSEINDDSKNWPKSCPFLHLKFKDFAITAKQRFISRAYYYWYFLVFTFLFTLMANTVTSLMSPTPQTDTVILSFLVCFVGFWWFFFCHFRLLYIAMRYRKGYLHVLYAIETFFLFCLGCYECFAIIGNLSQILSPLAPGSPAPVKMQPLVASIFLCVALGLWIIVMGYCFYFIRRAFYFKDLRLEEEKQIWLKEQQPGFAEIQKKRFSDWLIDLFREKPDKPLEPLRCGMLQGKDLWLQGQLNFETVYVEFKADVHIFDHLVWERYHYQDILEVRKYSETGLLLKMVNPAKRDLEDIEVIFDLGDRQLRTKFYKGVRRLWRRVGRNVSILHKMRLDKLRKSRRPVAIDLDEPDLVVAFDKARKMETRDRIAAHLVTYRDWQKLLGGIKIHVLHEGEALLSAGDDFDRLFHIAQGRIEVSEIVDEGTAGGESSFTVGSPSNVSLSEYKEDPDVEVVNREMRSWQKYSARRAGGPGDVEDPESHLEEEEPSEYEDPEDLPGGPTSPISGSSGSSSESEDVEAREMSESDFSESSYTDSSAYGAGSEFNLDGGPETVLLGTLQKDDIFGVVPFLLTRGETYPKSGLTFTARDPNTVLFSLDNQFASKSVFKPNKDVTAAFYKYLAVILGERTEAAEDAMFTRKVREKRLEEARAEEAQLAQLRQQEEEAVFSSGNSPARPSDEASKAVRSGIVRKLFNLPPGEEIVSEFKGRFTYRDKEDRRVMKVAGTFFTTSHYFAFHGKKFIDANKMEINREMKDIFRHDDIITIRYEGKKGVLFTDQKLERKMFEVGKSEDRDAFYNSVLLRWKNEGEITSKEMRKLLRRKMTRLSLGYLNAAEQLTSQTIEALLSDMTEKEKKQLFAGSVPIGLNRNQVVLGEQNYNENLYLLCTGIMRVQRLQEHIGNEFDTGMSLDRVVFQEIRSGEIFGFDSFLTGAPAYSSIVVDSEKAVVRSCTKEQIMMRLKEDRKLAAKFYRLAAVSIASRLSELSPLDLFL